MPLVHKFTSERKIMTVGQRLEHINHDNPALGYTLQKIMIRNHLLDYLLRYAVHSTNSSSTKTSNTQVSTVMWFALMFITLMKQTRVQE